MKTIDITPKWAPLIDPMIAVLQNATPGSATWKMIREELLRLAQCADQVNANRDAEIADYEAATTKPSDLPPKGYFGDFEAIIEPNEDRTGVQCWVSQGNEESSLAVVQDFGVIVSDLRQPKLDIKVPQKIIDEITEWAEDNGY